MISLKNGQPGCVETKASRPCIGCFRKILDVSGYARLRAFCENFGRRAGARATEHRFDAA